MKRNEFKKGDFVMMFNTRHHFRAYNKLLSKWFGPFVIKKVFVDNGFYELKNVNGSPYPDRINHDKLKKNWVCDSEDGIHNEFGSDLT
jgi:hypothetical protein